MRDVTLVQIFDHPITQKYVKRSGMAHAIACAYHAFKLSLEHNVNPDMAAKAALLHDIGHYTWYRNGKWDYSLYKENDIHAIKGAERAHKLLIRLGEHPKSAKEIALAVLLHTDSYLPHGELHLKPLQKVVHLADEADEEPSGGHHYRVIDDKKARTMLAKLDQQIDDELNKLTLDELNSPS
ncbi:HD domain-containing protein [Alkalicoccobacillus plakortidis]|uniref:HD domain-containing protein n=1 Tax=Alkalicoccobacillus plakortidis TaxID=444060 RepID=A0ABT0XGP6_9BACI|nr:HD domain-containing protein [Alkalicoccobacillus plakortidis]MCM2675064.1 HD domain-containing protein [Alkalicoccobacillus plakortidis]